jgi:HPt (histidine-containing phosphotransfer) domain-containing protein
MLPDDPSYPALCRAIEAGSSEEAFRAAHTLKGICQNLALTALYQQASTVTELLRGGKPVTEPVRTAFAQLQTTYRQTVECIRALD